MTVSRSSSSTLRTGARVGARPAGPPTPWPPTSEHEVPAGDPTAGLLRPAGV